MTQRDDAVTHLARALDQTGEVISRIGPGQQGLPTPCRSWNVGELVNHVVQDVRMFTARAEGEEWEHHESRLAPEEWSGAYDRAAKGLLEVWQRDGALDRTVKLPSGEVPASWQTGQQTSDLVVHAWDLAKATGQSTDLDPELGQMALDWGRENLAPEFRGKEEDGQVFGPEVTVPEEAPIYDRVAGYFGRDPASPSAEHD